MHTYMADGHIQGIHDKNVISFHALRHLGHMAVGRLYDADIQRNLIHRSALSLYLPFLKRNREVSKAPPQNAGLIVDKSRFLSFGITYLCFKHAAAGSGTCQTCVLKLLWLVFVGVKRSPTCCATSSANCRLNFDTRISWDKRTDFVYLEIHH